jgi:hypothetical protein
MSDQLLGFTRKFSLTPVTFSILLALLESGCTSNPAADDATHTNVQLQQRDSQIENLQKRLQSLEQRVAAQSGPASQIPAPPQKLGAVRPPSVVASAPSVPITQKAGTTVSSAPASTQPVSSGGAKDTNPFDVGEDAEAQRALERTLVISGALLVPYGQFEIQPGFTYQHYSTSVSTLVNDMIGSAYARLGLPWESQLEVYVPYQSIQQQNTGTISNSIYASNSVSGNGIGDVRVNLAKTLLTEKDWYPDVIARFGWQSNTGQVINSVPLGTGYNDLYGSLTFTKRQDPLVFYGTAGYQSAIATSTNRPGNILSFTLGTVLAASPETSLRAFLNQNFVSNYELNGQTISGSNMNISTLNLGASSILGRGLFLDFTAGVGLTNQSPDYTVGTSLAYRLDLPFMP